MDRKEVKKSRDFITSGDPIRRYKVNGKWVYVARRSDIPPEVLSGDIPLESYVDAMYNQAGKPKTSKTKNEEDIKPGRPKLSRIEIESYREIINKIDEHRKKGASLILAIRTVKFYEDPEIKRDDGTRISKYYQIKKLLENVDN